ncbi:MAG: tetratricopeptide repeat protein [Kiloniellales bacterium]
MSLRHTRLSFALVILTALSLATPAAAVKMITNDATPSEEFEEAVSLIDEDRYEDAIELLEEVAAIEPNSADVWNLLGFSYRSIGKTERAFASYNKALLINPDHIGANEYLGELYLQVGDLEKAKAQLRILETTCVEACPQIEQLQASIKAYEAKQ